MNNKIECEYCHGTGEVACTTCDGSGKVNCPECTGTGKAFTICPDCHEGRVLDPRGADDDDTMPCPTCHGNYKIANGTCKECDGTGKVDCGDCKGTGKVSCESCAGSGKFDVGGLISAVICDDWYDPRTRDKIQEDKLSEADMAMLRTAAEKGNGAAYYVLGVACGDRVVGRHCAFSQEGDAFFSKGAKAGDVNALYAHACVMPCDGLDPDLWRDMLDCLDRAAEKGNVHALVDLSINLFEGYPDYEQEDKENQEGLAPNFPKALKCCDMLSKVTQHDCVNKYVVAKANALGKLLPKVIKGDAAAMLELGRQFLTLNKETGCEEDKFTGEAFLKRAGENGNAEAVRLLAELNKNRDLGASVTMLDKAAQDGDKTAKEQLKSLMLECTKKQSRFDELKKVADSGNVAAMKFIASMYKEGTVGKDAETRDKEATVWYQKAADAGNGEAMLDLSLRYRDGKGCAKDINRAFALTVEGFEKGGLKRRAIRLLAEYYRWGYFAAPDYSKAITLYTRSANAGYAASMVVLGKCYVEGLGVKKNLCEAKRLFEMAAAKKSKDAGEELKKLPADIKASKKPISGVTGTPSKGPLPDFVLKDYDKAKAETLWSLTFEDKKKAAKKAGKTSQKKRWKFVLLGIFLGILGFHFLYARRKGWFAFYWLMLIANFVHVNVPAVANLVPAVAKVPVFGLLAGLTFVGSIFFMKKDGDGNKM